MTTLYVYDVQRESPATLTVDGSCSSNPGAPSAAPDSQ